MASTCASDRPEHRIDLMMRVFGIELGTAEASRIVSDYVKAVRKCKKCADGQSCRKLALPGLAGSLAPELCPNAELLADLMLQTLPRPDDTQLN